MKTLPILAAALCLASGTHAQQARFIAQGTISPWARDREDETLGGIGSGLSYDPKRASYLAVSDRGPGDGALDYRPRFDTLRATLSAEGKEKFKIDVLETTTLRDRDGKAMTGLTPDFRGSLAPQFHDGRSCIDPEGIALAPDGTVYIADEYGPFLYQFRREGTMLRRIQPPENYLPRTSQGAIDFGAREGVIAGRVPNHGFEGVALSSDGKKAILILQSGLTQDGGKSARFTRILVIDLVTEQAVGEYAYQLSDAEEISAARQSSRKNRVRQNDLSVSEITAVSEDRFLVLERDNHGANGSMEPKPAAFKCLYLVSTSGATNLLSLPSKPYGQQPGSENFRPLQPGDKVKPVQKKLVLNFASAFGGSDSKEFAAKWEGVALTPPDSNGRRTMLISCDNDFLNPTLQIEGKAVAFPRAKHPLPTRFLFFDLELR